MKYEKGEREEKEEEEEEGAVMKMTTKREDSDTRLRGRSSQSSPTFKNSTL